jgi:hypothetical protein
MLFCYETVTAPRSVLYYDSGDYPLDDGLRLFKDTASADREEFSKNHSLVCQTGNFPSGYHVGCYIIGASSSIVAGIVNTVLWLRDRLS